MFFPVFDRNYTFSLVNKTGQFLTGNSQKIFFTNVEMFQDKVIKNIIVFGKEALGNQLFFNFSGQRILSSPLGNIAFDYLNLVADNDEYILQNFPVTNLCFGFGGFNNKAKTYCFNRKINWYKSFVVRTSAVSSWEPNEGYLWEVYW